MQHRWTEDQLRGLWQRLEVDLRELVAEASPPADCAAAVIDYLDHNEFGLAWERLDDCLINPASDIKSKMADLAALMWPEGRQ